jgi:tetratricopeptide (TPR) repeat protein
LGGAWGLLLLKAAASWLVLFLLFRSARVEDTPVALLLAALLFSWQTFTFMHLRPHLFEGVFLAAAVSLFHRARSGRDPLWYGLLILVWANMHASAVLGAAALALHYVLGPDFRAPSARAVLRRLPVGLLLCSLVFATPNGLGILKVLSGHAGGEYLQLYIREWFAPEILPPLMYVALLAIAVGAFFRRDVLAPAEVLLILLFLIIGGGSKRFLYELGLLLIRPTAVLIGMLLERLLRRHRSGGGALRAWLYGLPLILSLALIYRPPFVWGALRAADYPLQERLFPHVAMALLRPVLDGEETVRVWNAYGWGGYLGWQGGGRLKVYIDGRTPTVFTEEMMLTEKLSGERPRLLQALLARWNADAVVLRRGAFLPIPPGDAEWPLVGFDSLSVIYLRGDLARRYDLPAIAFDPFREWPPVAVRQVGPAVAAVRRLLARDADNDLAWLRLGQMLGYMLPGGDESTRAEAMHALQRAIALNPDSASARLGLAHLRQAGGEAGPQVAQPVLELLEEKGARGFLGHEAEVASLLLDTGYLRQAVDVLSPDDWRRHQQLDEDFNIWLLRLVAYTRLGQTEEARLARHMAGKLALDAGPAAQQRLRAVLDAPD